MATLTWDAVGARRYENGVDRGVLYLSTGTGIAWNGLTSVTEAVEGEEVSPLYFDGKKYFDYVSPREYAASLKAFTYPDQFLEYDGIATTTNSVMLDNQVRKSFGLSYRTQVANDLNELAGYKLHVLYGCTAVPSDIEYATLGDSLDPIEFEWNLTARPQAVTGYRPTAHVIIDSTKVASDVLAAIEVILYGSLSTSPRLPTINELIGIVSVGFTITVTDNGDGTWTAVGPDGLISFIDPTTFQITGINAVVIDANTYTISST